MDDEINSLMNSVPDKQLEREREIQRLDHVKAVMERLADIRDSKVRIEAPVEKTNSSDSITFVETLEQSVKAALATQRSPGLDSETKKTEKPTFSEEIELISLWRDQTSPTADIFINGRVYRVNKGSIIKGWEITKISANYMTLTKDRATAKVYFSNIADEG
ncbi:hypothetical protein [uncultured Amphritea sp.]|uniref:hypothetical protein n=1 Tax=uncultured Amphritea sp. TaxID=981605 RepID=UPI00260D1E74|nr:hypothetical protein [uncultured Amphritea sp.]